MSSPSRYVTWETDDMTRRKAHCWFTKGGVYTLSEETGMPCNNGAKCTAVVNGHINHGGWSFRNLPPFRDTRLKELNA